MGAAAVAVQVMRALRLRWLDRRNWLRVASGVPRSSTLRWAAHVAGANLVVGDATWIDDGVRLVTGPATRPAECIRIGDRCRVRAGAQIHTLGGSVVIGDRCSINPHSIVYGAGGVVIGNYVRIAAHVVIVAAMHRFDRVDVPIHEQGSTASGITIEDDVWIGAGACILDNVRIGRGAVVAAGAVVVGDVAPYTVVGGVPARVLKHRRAVESPRAVAVENSAW